MDKYLLKKHIIFTSLSALAVHFSYSQQEAHYSLYFFNPTLINPAYSASANALKFVATGRNQWVNYDGAPKTAALSVYSPFLNRNIGVGVNLSSDQIGATKNTSSFLNFAYQIKFKSKRKVGSKSGGLYAIKRSITPSTQKKKKRDMNYLSFGLNAGFDMYQTQLAGLRIGDKSDPVYSEGYNYTKVLVNVGAGLYYYNSRHFFGVSVPHLSKNPFNEVVLTATQERHVYVFGGFIRETENNITIRPSFILKAVSNAPLSIDFNLSFLLKERIWIGGMYRYQSAMGFNLLYNMSNAFKLGYAYDYALTAIQRFSSGSHEIMLSYELLNKKKIKVASCNTPKF